MAAIADWRAAHPRASWTELEAAIDDELAGLRAQLLTDSAQASAMTDPPRAARPPCPTCGGVLHDAGRQERHLLTERDRTVVLRRTYLRCPACGTGLFPPG
jgi:YgiT-type zinc finger domain-containing protein